MSHRWWFALSAMALALSLLLPAQAPTGNSWFLFDQSPSSGGPRAIGEYLEFVDLPLDEWAMASSHDRVRVFPSTQLTESNDLAVALRAIAPQLQSSDRLYVVSDGRVLSPLATDILHGVDIVHYEIDSAAVVRHIQCPSFFDGQSKLQVDILLHDKSAANIQFGVNTEQSMLAAPRFVAFSDKHLQLTLSPAAATADFEFDLLLNGDLFEHFVVRYTQLPPLKLLTPPFEQQQLQQLLDSGVSCVVEYPTAAAVHYVAPPYRAFDISQQQLPSVVCLLDVSGSMGSGGLTQAVAALYAASKNELAVDLKIIPFSSSLQQPLSRFEELSQIQAFGPTDVTQVLHQLSQENYAPQQIIILSDGQSEVPPGGWRPLVKELFVDTPIVVLPCSQGAHLQSLAQLGDLVAEHDLAQSLLQQLDSAAMRLSSVGRLRSADFVDLEKQFSLSSAYNVFDANSRSNVLYADDQHNPLLTVDYFGDTRLYSVAGKCDQDALAQISDIEQRVQQQKRWRFSADGLMIYSGNVPYVTQGLSPCQVRLIDATADNNLFIVDVDPSQSVELHQKDGQQAISIRPRVAAEFAASAQTFQFWLEQRSDGKSDIHIFALFCALLLFLGGYFVYYRS